MSEKVPDVKAATGRAMQKAILAAGPNAKAAYVVVDFGEHGIFSSVWRDDKEGFERIGMKVLSDFPQVEPSPAPAVRGADGDK